LDAEKKRHAEHSRRKWGFALPQQEGGFQERLTIAANSPSAGKIKGDMMIRLQQVLQEKPSELSGQPIRGS